jgi:phosphoglycerol transferase MdoB-like AlkP superfamily enzyme
MKRNNLAKVIISIVLALFFWTFICLNVSEYTAFTDEEIFRMDYFITSLVSAAAICFLGVTRFKMNKAVNVIIGTVVYIIAAFGAMHTAVMLSDGFNSGWFIYLSNMALYLAFGAAALLISGSLRVSAICTVLSSFIFNGISFIVYSFRGTSLMPTDLLAWGTAMNVASQYTFKMEYQFITATVFTVALVMLAFKFPLKFKFKGRHFVTRGAGAAALAGIILFITSADYSKIDVSEYDQYFANLNFGSALSFYINSTKMGLVKSDTYNPEALDQMLLSFDQPDAEIGKPDAGDKTEAPEKNPQETENPKPTEAVTQSPANAEDNKVIRATTAEKAINPNIIVIMNESYCDFSVINDFKTNVDYMQFYNSLENNTIKGQLFVSPFGGYTCNTEYEFLTGMSTSVLQAKSAPYLQLIFKKLPYSINTHMHKLGYKTTAMHPFYADGWNRTAIYNYLDFDEFISLENFDKYSEYPEKIRGYVSDKGNYGAILNLLDQKESGEKQFIFNITIQNHGGYDFDEFPAEVFLEDMSGSYPQTEQYLTLMKHSDDALRYFINALKRYDEPILLVMFGDHMPNVERGFYEELYGKSLDAISYEEAQKRYIVPFMIWANYDIEEQTDVKSSPCYLSNMIMEQAKLPKSRVQMYLDDLRSDIVQINPMAYYDAEGNWHMHSETDRLDEYYDLQYALLKGENLHYDYRIEGESEKTFGSHVISLRYVFGEEYEKIMNAAK